jgi:hypothetical protein
MIQCLIHNVKQTTNIRYVVSICTTEYYIVYDTQCETDYKEKVSSIFLFQRILYSVGYTLHSVQHTINKRYVESACTTEYDTVQYLLYSVQSINIRMYCICALDANFTIS